MKKVFPVIVFLITLSVLGIMFIQLSWINNAIQLKKEQFQREIDNSLTEIRQSIQDRFIAKKGVLVQDDESKQFYLETHFTVQLAFTKDEVNQIIDRCLKQNNIKQPYEYCISNYFDYPLFISSGFSMQTLGNSYTVRLTPDNATMGKETLYISVKEDKNYIIKKMAGMIIASVLFTTIIILAFALTVRTLFNQKKLSEIKSDFINNMTHELKTPLATISLAIDALVNERVIHDTEKIQYYSGMIKEENRRMNKQVETILQAARIERQEIKLNLQRIDAHELIQKVANNLTLQIQEKQGSLVLRLKAARHIIDADEVHFSNIIFNLLDNAMKYSKGNLHIEVETVNTNGNMLAVRVKDNGIGMNKETQSRVFEKFYRAHTGNRHDVKGFGLGLSYVKALAEAHSGKVKVESALGKGSTFTVYMPVMG